MLRVLHSVSNMGRAGIETMLMNYYREIDRSRIQFDFLANKPVPGEYDEEIRRLGGRVFVSPGLNPLHFPRYRRYMAELPRIMRRWGIMLSKAPETPESGSGLRMRTIRGLSVITSIR